MLSLPDETADLKRHPHFRYYVVVPEAESGHGDLLAGCQNKIGVFRFPALAPNGHIRCRCNEALRFSVKRSGMEGRRLILDVEPGVRRGMELCGRIPFNSAALQIDFAGWQKAAHAADQGEPANPLAHVDVRRVVGSLKHVLMNARRERVIQDGRHGEVAVFSIAGDDAVLYLCRRIAEAVRRAAGVVTEERWRIEIDLYAPADDHADAVAVAVIENVVSGHG